MSYNYSRTIYKDNREAFAKLFLGDNIEKYSLSEPVQKIRKITAGHLKPEAEKQLPAAQIVWRELQWFSHLGRDYHGSGVPSKKPERVRLVLELHTHNGVFFAMRNGNNAGEYNYVIFDVTRQSYLWAMNVQETIGTLQVYGMPATDLPLLIGTKMKPKLAKVFEYRLREE